MDELTTPLGIDSAKARRRPFPFLIVGSSIIVGLFVVAGAWVWLTDDPFGGDPVAVAPIERTASAVANASGKTADAALAKAVEAAKVVSTSIGGAKVISVPPPADAPPIGRGVANGDAVVITDPAVAPPVNLTAVDIDALLERTPDGIVPRVSADGRRPMDLYARPADATAVGTARVAIIVGGLGISDSSTGDALDRLPGEVTLAFAPYGDDLRAWAAKARRGGHELLLQIPLEPFGYPNNDPGPDTLLVANSPSDNVSLLHRLLGRIGTYVGVTNYMGARFTAEGAAMAPVFADLGKRGLLYLDDGTSSRSRAREASTVSRVPFATADLVLDATLEARAIDDRLDQLVTMARERGFAIGVATAYPLSIDRIAAFAKSAAGQGVVIVPLTTLADAKRS